MSFRYFYFGLLLTLSGVSKAGEIRLLTWPDYLPMSVIQAYTEKTTHEVKLHFYESDETKDLLMHTSRGSNYDIVVTSLFRLQNYSKQGWFDKVSKKSISNLKHLSTKWKKTYEQSNKHCIPYLWGSLGILYRKDHVNFEIKQWHDFFSPPKNFKGKINLLNDSRDIVGMALLSIGHKVNSKKLKHIHKVQQVLTDLQPWLASINALELSPYSPIISGNISMTMAYNGDALSLMSQSDKLAFTTPSNGTGLRLDCMAIPVAAQNKKLAHDFINYIHQPEVSAKISETLYYATPNKSALTLLPSKLRNNQMIYPKSELVERSDFHKPLSSKAQKTVQTIYSQLNFKLKARYKAKNTL